MSESVTHIFWCKQCRRAVNAEPGTDHQFHETVGIRSDLFVEGVERMIWELKVQGRLLLTNPGK